MLIEYVHMISKMHIGQLVLCTASALLVRTKYMCTYELCSVNFVILVILYMSIYVSLTAVKLTLQLN
jgi:hypothetical protein